MGKYCICYGHQGLIDWKYVSNISFPNETLNIKDN